VSVTDRQISVSYQPSLRDVLHAARVAEGATWKTPSRVAAVFLLAFSVVFFYWRIPGWGILFLALALAELFNLLPMSALAAWLEFKRNPKYREQFHLTLTPEHLAFRTTTLESTIKWEFYTRFWETNRAFVLAYGRGVPTVIPKAAFVADADRQAARELLTEVVTKRMSSKSGAA
jgi:hypothetical protein